MTINVADLKLFASAYPVDETYGGGAMISSVVQDGTENSIFPDIDATARAAGRVQLRKVFLAVTSMDADTLYGAQVSLKVPPTDAAVGVVAFTDGGQTSTRDAAVARLIKQPYQIGAYLGDAGGATSATVLSLPFAPSLGSLLVFAELTTSITFIRAVGIVSAVSGAGPYSVTLAFRRGSATIASSYGVYAATPAAGAARCIGATVLTANVNAAGTKVSVAAVEQKILPVTTAYPVVVNGLGTFLGPNVFAEDVSQNSGLVPIFRVGEVVVLRSGATTETAIVSEVDYRGGLTFAAGLANAYPSGAIVSSLLSLGDQPVLVAASFAQQTWTRVFSDALIGNPISANYNRTAGPITSTNLGSATERWAIVFTSATAFKLIGETVGQIAIGDIGTAFSPLNPITNTPYFTIPTTGWGTGWATGNVLRFNTLGSRAPFWVARIVKPSAPGGLDGSSFELRGTIGA